MTKSGEFDTGFGRDIGEAERTLLLPLLWMSGMCRNHHEAVYQLVKLKRPTVTVRCRN